MAAGEGDTHGTDIFDIITDPQGNNSEVEPIGDRVPVWLGRAVGSGKWAEALTEFVDAAQASGQMNAVVNLSFDLAQVHPDGSVSTRLHLTLQEYQAIEYARQNGVLIVVAAGNDPAAMSALGQASLAFDNILTVGAVDGLERAGYSSYGLGLDLLAPGVVEDRAGGITRMGTSIAAAQVTRAVSQVWAAHPDFKVYPIV